jgi:hypothetical protein
VRGWLLMLLAVSPHWLFIANMRVSTAILWLLFCVVGVMQRRLRRAMLAGIVWLLGWEVAWQVASWLESSGRAFSLTILVFVGSAAIVFLLQRKAVLPYLPLIAVSLTIGAAWVATGFHVNGYNTVSHFNALGEAFNESAKTAWGIAYLWPLWRMSRLRDLRAGESAAEQDREIAKPGRSDAIGA